MRWSPQQEDALAAVARWLKRGDTPVFRLFGFAGTGKTTLARHIAEDIDGKVAFAAFTGKAAHVLRLEGLRGRRHHPQPDLPAAGGRRRGAAGLRHQP